LGDAVAGAVDAVAGVEVDFFYDAGHVYALVVAGTAGLAGSISSENACSESRNAASCLAWGGVSYSTFGRW
jgi:hypothetical protein